MVDTIGNFMKTHEELIRKIIKKVGNKMKIEIFWNDLTKEKQNEILEVLGENGNYDVIPIATIEVEEEEEE